MFNYAIQLLMCLPVYLGLGRARMVKLLPFQSKGHLRHKFSPILSQEIFGIPQLEIVVGGLGLCV